MLTISSKFAGAIVLILQLGMGDYQGIRFSLEGHEEVAGEDVWASNVQNSNPSIWKVYQSSS